MILKLDNRQVLWQDVGDKEINQKCCKVIKVTAKELAERREKVYIL